MIGTKLGHEITAYRAWHEIHRADPAHRWLREMIGSTAAAVAASKRRRVGFLLTTLLMSVAAAAQQPTSAGERFGLGPGPHAVGFRLLVEQDRSRYVSASDGTGTHARPIRVYVWYP